MRAYIAVFLDVIQPQSINNIHHIPEIISHWTRSQTSQPSTIHSRLARLSQAGIEKGSTLTHFELVALALRNSWRFKLGHPLNMTTMLMTTTTPAPSTSMVAHPPPCKPNSSYRLLYRGALSLADSEVFLEGNLASPIETDALTRFSSESPGITFVADLPCKSSKPLMSSPVPLALESMRGRSALRLVGVVKTMGIKLEFSDEVSMYVLILVS